jgi:hypothetical protein
MCEKYMNITLEFTVALYSVSHLILPTLPTHTHQQAIQIRDFTDEKTKASPRHSREAFHGRRQPPWGEVSSTATLNAFLGRD